jgi:hypothetical protein
MAYGTAAKARAYGKKVMKLERRMATLTDGRCGPKVPLAPIMTTWFWAMVKRLPSMEQAGKMLKDLQWRKKMELRPDQGGGPDMAGRALDQLSIDELNEILLEVFFDMVRAGTLKPGPFGLRCIGTDANELFKSEKRHCPLCQERKKTVKRAGQEVEVTEYFHQAVCLAWFGEDFSFPLAWELVEPGGSELNTAIRLLDRLLPRLRQSVDVVLADALYCCRPFLAMVERHHCQSMVICLNTTEMEAEMDYLIANENGGSVLGGKLLGWEMLSSAWEKDVKTKLRVIHLKRVYDEPDWKKVRKDLRVVTTLLPDKLPLAQAWNVGRSRWDIENPVFNELTRDYSLEHNYRHSTPAIVALLVVRSLALGFTKAYHLFATARSKDAPATLLDWFQALFEKDWVRYLDGDLDVAVPDSG